MKIKFFSIFFLLLFFTFVIESWISGQKNISPKKNTDCQQNLGNFGEIMNDIQSGNIKSLLPFELVPPVLPVNISANYSNALGIVARDGSRELSENLEKYMQLFTSISKLPRDEKTEEITELEDRHGFLLQEIFSTILGNASHYNPTEKSPKNTEKFSSDIKQIFSPAGLAVCKNYTLTGKIKPNPEESDTNSDSYASNPPTNSPTGNLGLSQKSINTDTTLSGKTLGEVLSGRAASVEEKYTLKESARLQSQYEVFMAKISEGSQALFDTTEPTTKNLESANQSWDELNGYLKDICENQKKSVPCR